MKTYKTWEMIKEIIENPKKKYRPVNDTDGYVEFKNNQLVWNSRGQRGQVMIVTETDENEWEEVKESQRRNRELEENPLSQYNITQLKKDIKGLEKELRRRKQ